MFVREILDITNRTPQVPVIMSGYDEDINPLTLEQEEINILMEERFEDDPTSRVSSIYSTSSSAASEEPLGRGIPDLPPHIHFERL